ncbi:DUF3506 domain-containing protein [Skeletonema marinoi]|uniref:DUF3506 domain-containing protein n=1 Tax=Skeletonema marinoi TaxID=267567 RepID=A0AAD9DBV9_9STRA|nr:DUF3506 domain-containing protein [Skeletonema marinoi]
MSSFLLHSAAFAALLVSPLTNSFTLPINHEVTRYSSSWSSTLQAAASADDQQRRPSFQEAGQLDPPSISAAAAQDGIYEQHQQFGDATTDRSNDKDVNSFLRSSEFADLEPLTHSETRSSRLDAENRLRAIYTTAGTDPYWSLRDEIIQLESDLDTGRDVGISEEAVSAVRNLLRKAQSKDPEHVYRITSAAAAAAERMGRVEESEKYREESLKARKMLPWFNLEGLWVGKYGTHGFEMINVTYSGDMLIAYKVTGDKNIPRGEISFTADLTPQFEGSASKLDPIVLSENSAKKWGTKKLPRFSGEGHAAEPGYVNNQFLEGQLVVIGEGDYFSFAWIPLEHQIFFGRPSPELTLKMLREGGGTSLTAGLGMSVPGLDAHVKDQTDYVNRCLEVTKDTFLDEWNEGKTDSFSGIWHGNEEECYFE